ncbi:MAG TPA: YfiR family protein [Candidatus Acidoferrales bacterium]|nr:YfiR family protein [Candidatus Acidoferrales bacterium]
MRHLSKLRERRGRWRFRLAARVFWCRWKHSLALLLATLVPFACSTAGGAQTNSPGEYQLKAAFLFNFAKFIEWPPTSFANPQSPFFICVLGMDPFGRTIDDLLAGKAIGNHPVSIERSDELAEERHCQVVFVSSAEKRRVREVLNGLKGTNSLVVGETEGFAAAGGVIQFDLEENHVRFLINTDAADRAGLKVSSKLLSLAKVVHDAPGNDRS